MSGPASNARIGVAATIVVGQLWALTVALNQWFSGGTVWVLVGFEALSFAITLTVWLAAPDDR